MAVSLPIIQRGVFTRLVTAFVGDEFSSGTKHSYLIGAGTTFSISKGPTDYLFTVSLTLQNVADGSRYRIEDTSDDSEVASGIQSGTGDITISGIGYLGSPRTLRVKVRKGTTGPKYLPFETNVSIGATGGSSYISQVLDTIA